jgi:hypothetical protein
MPNAQTVCYRTSPRRSHGYGTECGACACNTVVWETMSMHCAANWKTMTAQRLTSPICVNASLGFSTVSGTRGVASPTSSMRRTTRPSESILAKSHKVHKPEVNWRFAVDRA